MDIDYSLIAQGIGWAASIFALASYGFKSVAAVRAVNLVGAVLFVIYGVMIAAPGVVMGNAGLAAVQILYLATRGRFADIAEQHRGIVWAAFGTYAAAMGAWVGVAVVWAGMPISEILGVIAAAGLIGGFLMADESKMRGVCAWATVAWILYAMLIGSVQVGITNAVALGVNGWKMLKGRKRRRRCDETVRGS